MLPADYGSSSALICSTVLVRSGLKHLFCASRAVVTNESQRKMNSVPMSSPYVLCAVLLLAWPTTALAQENRSSGGALVLDGIRVSRTECVSPCPVMFSVDAMTDGTTDDPFVDNGVYWDYGDPDADEQLGVYDRGARYFVEGTGASRETDMGTPLGMHTYICDSGICSYEAGVAVRNAAGDWATAWRTITVESQEVAYPGTQTVCVSSDGNWSGDIPCPVNARHATALPTRTAWENDTRYLVRRGEVHNVSNSCIAYDRRGILIGAFGDSTSPRPEISAFGIGRDNNCNDLNPADAVVLNYTNPYWIEDITLDGLRVASIDLGMTFRNVTLHDLDMDFEDQASGGGISSNSTDRCTKDATLSCSNVPLPYGFYLSSSRMIGSRTFRPGVNLGFMSATLVSFFGVIDAEVSVAVEHNLRVEGSSRLLVIHSDFNGDHSAQGDKHAITIRPEGHLNEDMLLFGVRPDTTLRENVFESRYTVIKDVYLGTPSSSGNAARVTIEPTAAAYPELSRWGLVSGNVTDMGAGAPPISVALAGAGLACYSDNTWDSPQGCKDTGPQAIPGQPARPDMTPPMLPNPPATY